MERYYSILGIPSNSSREVIKNAYHAKMKALHPDKIHGTPLEDTATFFTAEINEAYTNLMAKFKSGSSASAQNNQTVSFEEDIYIAGYGCLRYTLSNNINAIISEIYKRFKCSLHESPSQIQWDINHSLSPNVKKTMNNHNVIFSTSLFWKGSVKYVAINKKSGSNWYVACYEIMSQPKKKAENKETYYNSYQYTSNTNTNYSEKLIPFWTIVKMLIAIAIFGVIFYQCNNQQPAGNRPQSSAARQAQGFATVVSCDWLNVRKTPSSVNNNNIIEAISVNTRVEVLERQSNGWARIRYSNGRTGYVYGNFLTR